MAEKPEDLNLPTAVVTRIIKEALPENCNVAKDAKLALAKSASVFVLYLASFANNKALANSRKTINKNDVLAALQEIEFDKFEEPLMNSLELYQKMQKSKKDATATKKQVTEVEQDTKEPEDDMVEVVE